MSLCWNNYRSFIKMVIQIKVIRGQSREKKDWWGKVMLELKTVSPDLMAIQWSMWLCYEKMYLASTVPDCSWEKKIALMIAKWTFWISSHIIHMWAVASHFSRKALVLALMQWQLFLHRSEHLLLQHALGPGTGLASVSRLVLAWIRSLIVFTI